MVFTTVIRIRFHLMRTHGIIAQDGRVDRLVIVAEEDFYLVQRHKKRGQHMRLLEQQHMRLLEQLQSLVQ